MDLVSTVSLSTYVFIILHFTILILHSYSYLLTEPFFVERLDGRVEEGLLRFKMREEMEKIIIIAWLVFLRCSCNELLALGISNLSLSNLIVPFDKGPGPSVT